MKMLRSLAAALALLALGVGSAPAQTKLKVGDMAPDFTLNSTAGKPIRLSDFRGKQNVVLAFYVLAFTGG
jgi:hypothetical protein